MQNIPAPKTQKAPVEAFTKDEIDAMLKACSNTRKAETRYRASFTFSRPTAKRDRAIILMLLDTGLRARELTSLLIGNVNLKTGRVIVEHGVIGGAKGGKGRTVFIGKSSRRALWRYLTSREDGDNSNSPLFLAIGERKILGCCFLNFISRFFFKLFLLVSLVERPIQKNTDCKVDQHHNQVFPVPTTIAHSEDGRRGKPG